LEAAKNHAVAVATISITIAAMICSTKAEPM
jgi:hypothetical protein